MHSGIDTATLIKKLFFYNKNRYFLYETEKQRNMKKYEKRICAARNSIFLNYYRQICRKNAKMCVLTPKMLIFGDMKKYTTGEITRYKSVFLQDIKRY